MRKSAAYQIQQLVVNKEALEIGISPLEVTLAAVADEIAAAASLLQGQAAEGQPVVIVRGLTWNAPDASVAELHLGGSRQSRSWLGASRRHLVLHGNHGSTWRRDLVPTGRS